MTSGTVHGPDLAVLAGVARLAIAIVRRLENTSGARLNLANSGRAFAPPCRAR